MPSLDLVAGYVDVAFAGRVQAVHCFPVRARAADRWFNISNHMLMPEPVTCGHDQFDKPFVAFDARDFEPVTADETRRVRVGCACDVHAVVHLKFSMIGYLTVPLRGHEPSSVLGLQKSAVAEQAVWAVQHVRALN